MPAELQQHICALLLRSELHRLRLDCLLYSFEKAYEHAPDLSRWLDRADPLQDMLRAMGDKVVLIDTASGRWVELRNKPAPPPLALQLSVQTTVKQCGPMLLRQFPSAFTRVIGKALQWEEWGILVNMLAAMPEVCRLERSPDGEWRVLPQ